VHNLKPKSSGVILTPRAMFVPFYAFLLFVVCEVEHEQVYIIFGILGATFAGFYQFFLN